MSKRADQIRKWQTATAAPPELPTRQPTRPEDTTGDFNSPFVVIRSHEESDKPRTGQRVRQTDDPLTVSEVEAGLKKHVAAFGPVFEVHPLPDTPHSFWKIEGLVVPEPDDLAAEDLGASFVGVILLPGDFIMINLKVPGAAATDPNEQTTEGGSV